MVAAIASLEIDLVRVGLATLASRRDVAITGPAPLTRSVANLMSIGPYSPATTRREGASVAHAWQTHQVGIRVSMRTFHLEPLPERKRARLSSGSLTMVNAKGTS
jgi:hypothetical protein